MTAEPTSTIPSPLNEPVRHNSVDSEGTPASLSSETSEDDTLPSTTRPSNRLSRPKLGSRKSSGSMIVPREGHTGTVVVDDELEEGDVRTMSPRRNSEEVDKLGEEARKDLIAQARTLQLSLQAIVDRVETVKSEHQKLEGGNKFLQSYIGELMQTSKITSTSMSKSKGKRPSGK